MKLAPYEWVLICAKTEELREVIAELKKYFEIINSGKRSDVVFEIPCGAGSIRLLVTTCHGMGHMRAALRTAEIISTSQPEFIFFVGTAASLDPANMQLGDVAIPTSAVYRTYEKVTEEGQDDYKIRYDRCGGKEVFLETNILCADTDSLDAARDLQAAVASLDINDLRLESGEKSTVKIEGKIIELRRPKVNDDSKIFSCGMVVDSISYRDHIKKELASFYRKVDVIDMESFGFFKAIDFARRNNVGTSCEGIMIRGVSDYAGRKKPTENLPDDWKSIAVRNASIVTAVLMKILAQNGPAQFTI